MRQYKVILHTDRAVAHLGVRDCCLVVLRRAGGPADNASGIPRYYAGVGMTREWALRSAYQACREHGSFEPVLDDRPKSKRP